VIAYFAYGTTQQGFTHHRRLAGLLGEPVGRVRTAAPHAVVVPRRAACSNAGCEYVHRMAVLVPGLGPHVEGDLFEIGETAAAAIDALETGPGSPYLRAQIEVSGERTARAYLAREPARWRALVERGGADALSTYPFDLAATEELKPCCLRAPGHPPPHDVVDPLAGR
jgi:gamma-glutamylcyclotransferase (GGCT)/AIG2-like uncharacterized protein YtfP